MAKSKQLSQIFQKKTKSHIPKTPREKEMWIAARRIVASQTGKKKHGEKGQDLTSGQWGLVTHIYQNAKKAGKIPKQADWEKAKKGKAVSRYGKDPKAVAEHKRAEDRRRKKMHELKKKYQG